MAFQLSPGVVTQELDLSNYAERASTATLAIVGTARRGPVNEVITVTNELQLIETFGLPFVDTDNVLEPGKVAYRARGLVAAGIQYLRYGNQLRVVRIAHQNNILVPTKDGTATTPELVLDDGSAADTLSVKPSSPGSWSSELKVRVQTASTATKVINGQTYAAYKLEVYYGTRLVESYDNMVHDPAVADDQDFDENRVNGVSKYVVLDGVNSNPNAPTAFGSPVAVGAGADGEGSLSAADFIGTVAGTGTAELTTGLKLLYNADQIDINVVACPGVNQQISDDNKAVIAEMVTLCETRRDCVALIDAKATHGGKVVTPGVAKAFINGTTPFSANSTNSSYAAYYWPWVKVFDSYNQKEVWMPPSGLVAGQLAYNDRVSDPWFAAAGFSRGKLLGALGLAYNTTLGEREDIYGPAQCVNPIVSFVPEGITIWGAKTTQRAATALNRLPVRRMVSAAQKIVATAAKVLVFELNDELTQLRFVQIVEPVFQVIKARRGLREFRVICDASTNPPELVDQNIMRGVILLRPTKTAEVIQVDFVITNSGTSFDEILPNI